MPDFRITRSDEPVGGTDIIMRRERGAIVCLFNGTVSQLYLGHSHNKLAAYMHWFGQTPGHIREIVVDASDGDAPNTARYTYCARSAENTPLPDPHFFRDHGYRATDRFAADNAANWDDRSDQILWRGALNNVGLFSLDPALNEHAGVMQRLRMALKCRDNDVDFRFVAQPDRPHDRILDTAGLIGGYIPTHDWAGMKYAIDIDGYTNAWCNLMQRLKLGCCVLKVTSPFGYYQWYYDRLVPWEHFIPISADLSDLNEKIDWARTHQSKSRDIAKAGQTLAKSLTFESERQVAVNAIVERERA